MKFKLLLALPLLAFCLALEACIGPVPVDVVMDGGDIYFVLEDAYRVSAIRVMALAGGRGQPPLWDLRHDAGTPLKTRKYPTLKVIKYGAKLEEFPVVTGPAELARDVEYVVAIDLGDRFAKENFVITGDNKVVMPRPAFQRQRGRVYTAATDKDGNKTFALK